MGEAGPEAKVQELRLVQWVYYCQGDRIDVRWNITLNKPLARVASLSAFDNRGFMYITGSCLMASLNKSRFLSSTMIILVRSSSTEFNPVHTGQIRIFCRHQEDTYAGAAFSV